MPNNPITEHHRHCDFDHKSISDYRGILKRITNSYKNSSMKRGCVRLCERSMSASQYQKNSRRNVIKVSKTAEVKTNIQILISVDGLSLLGKSKLVCFYEIRKTQLILISNDRLKLKCQNDMEISEWERQTGE